MSTRRKATSYNVTTLISQHWASLLNKKNGLSKYYDFQFNTYVRKKCSRHEMTLLCFLAL